METELAVEIRGLLLGHQCKWHETNSGHGYLLCQCGWQSDQAPGYMQEKRDHCSVQYHTHLFHVLIGEW